MAKYNGVNDDLKVDPITLQEVEGLAHKRLPKAVFDYYACGADDQNALQRNIDAFTR